MTRTLILLVVLLLGAGFATVRLLTSVGDMTGDGWPDLMGQPKGLPMQIYPGRGLSGIAGSYTAYSRLKGGRLMGMGLMDRDGAPDTVIKRKGRLTIYPGNGPGGLRAYPKTLKRSVKKMNWLVGVSDIDGRGHADLIVRLKGSGELRYLRGRGQSFRSGSSLGSASGYDKVGGGPTPLAHSTDVSHSFGDRDLGAALCRHPTYQHH